MIILIAGATHIGKAHQKASDKDRKADESCDM